jgi:leucyl/phenylalanyl-tRNA---protein transferase
MRRSRGIPVLSEALAFPEPSEARADGLLAVGGDLSVDRLLLAYRSGIFPWSCAPITWWSPDPRAILPHGGLHVSRSLARHLRQPGWRVTMDQAFAGVIAGCATPAPGREETWIEPDLMEAYMRLHAAGHAHSVEVWRDDVLAGGIYGVAVGRFFAGESMFHRVSNASKIALVHLVDHLDRCGFTLFDTQVASPLTRSMGAVDMPRLAYLERLKEAVIQPNAWQAHTMS